MCSGLHDTRVIGAMARTSVSVAIPTPGLGQDTLEEREDTALRVRVETRREERAIALLGLTIINVHYLK